MDGDGNINKFGVIDSAKLQSYDPETQTVKLRIDVSNVPGFWMEINLKSQKNGLKNVPRRKHYDSKVKYFNT